MAFDLGLIIADMESLSRANDFGGLEEAAGTVLALVRSGDTRIDGDQVDRILELIRRKRQFELLIRVVDVLAERGAATPKARRLHAQALIDSGRAEAAIPALRQLAADCTAGEREHKEAQGLLGRAYKQLYIDAAARGSPGNPQHLTAAIDEYARIVARCNIAADHWHAINFTALTARAERDGIDPGHPRSSRELAQDMICVLERRASGPEADNWTLASLGEALVALGAWDKAKPVYQRYLEQPGIDLFEVASCMRQLVEVWQLKRASPGGGEILGLCETRLGQLAAGPVPLTASDGRRFGQLDALMGAAPEPAPDVGRAERATRGSIDISDPLPPLSLLPVRWLFLAGRRAESVASIRHKHFRSLVGTGFLVRASDLEPSLGKEIMLLTNSHVVGRLAGAELPPSLAVAEFHLMEGGTTVLECTDVVWESRSDLLDASLVRLSPPPADIAPCDLADIGRYPDDLELLPHAERRCLLVGHAGDLQLNWTPAPCEILDLGFRDETRPEHVYLHHAAPTRDGSSGSPIFDMGWNVIGLHRAGTERTRLLRALGGRAGERNAKIAVTLRSIARQIAIDRGRRAPAASAATRAGRATPADSEVPLDAASVSIRDASDETLAALLEYDPEASLPFCPALKPRPRGDGSAAEHTMSDVWGDLAATGASALFRLRRNYHFTRASGSAPDRGLKIVSDGDSWFQLPVPGVRDTIDHLGDVHAIDCLAGAGVEFRSIAANAHTRILPAIRRVRPDAVLLSGGGNDILGFSAISLHVRPFEPGVAAEAHILAALDGTLATLYSHYEGLIAAILDEDERLKIFCHGYDWAIPQPPSGRWLNRPLREARGIADDGLQRGIVKVLIDRFNEHMQALERRFPGKAFFVDCRGCVGSTRSSWFDELHPRTSGFRRVADRFNRRIAEAFAGDARVAGLVPS